MKESKITLSKVKKVAKKEVKKHEMKMHIGHHIDKACGSVKKKGK